ncbi:MAG TPA: PAS domain S-box protein [Roseiflexaceae bacterium]|nr:PAS domain S-box protein [Roseiflexaceae bacterium]
MPVIVAVLVNLGQNVALWFAALWIFRLASSHWRFPPSRREALVLGVLAGGLGLLGIAPPVEVAPGIFVDTRAPLIVLAGVWGGPLAAAAAGGLSALAWIWSNGAGVPFGVATSLSLAGLGALIWEGWGRYRLQIAPAALVLLGLGSALVSLVWAAALQAGQAGLGWVAPLMLLVYSIGSLLFGAAFAFDRRRETIDAEPATDRHTEAELRESEERYARLADAAFEGLALSENGVILDANAQLDEMFGYAREELIGMPVEQTVAPESRDLVRRRAQTGYSGPYEHLAQRKDGTIFPVEVRGRAIQYQGRRVRLTAIRDISERTAAQQALIASEQRFRAAFHASPTPQALSQASDGTILDVNTAFEQFIGFSRDELLGQIAADQPIWSDDPAPMLADLQAHGRLANRAIRLRTRMGAIRDVNVSIEPVQVGDTPGFLSVLIDVTEQLAAEQALARSERMLKELVQSINAVVWEADAQTFVFSFVSEQAEKLLGYPVSAWYESSTFWVEHIHPDDREAAVNYCMYCTQALINHEFEYRMIAADGRIVWLRDLVTVVAEGGAPVRLRGVMVDVTAPHQAEADRASSEVRFQTIFEQATIGIALVNMAGWPIETNSALQEMLGYSADELRSMAFVDFTHPADVDADVALFGELVRGEREFYQITKRYLHKNGQVVWGNLRISLVHGSHGESRFAIGMVEDITERKRIEAQYLQAQKIEAIGRLAGGVAHDFNNLLTVILGNCELLLADLDADEPVGQDVAQIRQAADRAAVLTRQLLAFSRKQLLNPTRLDLNLVVTNVEGLLRRLIGEDIVLISRLDADLHAVQADPSQIEQVIMNLAVNARDAMPGGGTLIIETANAVLDANSASMPGAVESGPYCMLAVSDTGSGMDAVTQARIFEPFFTTKASGKGTGLGLATVYGIVQQSGGCIWVYSELGHGTTFKIYLPQAVESTGDARAGTPAADALPALQDTGTILLLEDDPLVRELASRVLQAQGYRVLEAGDGAAALQIAAQTGAIDVLLTDVIIPGGMSGPQVAGHVQLRHPDLQVLYMSGYTDAAITHHAGLEPGRALLQKPFTVSGLAQAVWKARRAQSQPAGAEDTGA